MTRYVAYIAGGVLSVIASRHRRPRLYCLWGVIVLFELLLIRAMLDGFHEAWPFVAVLVPLTFPWLVARYLFAPLGMWRSAYAFGWLARLTWGSDGSGGTVAAAYALLRQRRPSARGIRWVESRRDHAKLCATRLVASGFVEAARANPQRARILLASTDKLDPADVPQAHRMAREWLAADGASRGDWRSVSALARQPLPTTRATRFLCAVADVFVGRVSAPSQRMLFWLWLAAPARRKTRALLHQAENHRDSTPRGRAARTSVSCRPAGHGEPFHDAINAHVALLSQAASDVEIAAVESACAAWDRALEGGAIEKALWQRAADLGWTDGAEIATELHTTVVAELASIVRAAGHPIELYSGNSDTLDACRASVRHQLLDELEIAFGKLEGRTDVRRELSNIDEWCDWLALTRLYTDAANLGGMELRRTAFPFVHCASCNFAVWLWNDRKEQMVANCIFRWLLDEAIRVGDAEAIELQRNNVEP